jgi:hypothetical protein
MSDPVVTPELADSEAPSPRGQSLVEFALVLPMLIVLFLGIADFGRAFQAGITVEGIARNSAEILANDERMSELLDTSCDSTCRAANYAELHSLASTTACDEARRLDPSTDVDGTCAGLLVVGACIHDADTMMAIGVAGDSTCGVVTGGMLPDGCGDMKSAVEPWPNSQDGVVDPVTLKELRYVEVRVCYRFTPLYSELSLPFISYLVPDQIYLERSRFFTVSMDY